MCLVGLGEEGWAGLRRFARAAAHLPGYHGPSKRASLLPRAGAAAAPPPPCVRGCAGAAWEHGSHTRRAKAQPCSRARCRLHASQQRAPQARQWCRRVKKPKLARQIEHEIDRCAAGGPWAAAAAAAAAASAGANMRLSSAAHRSRGPSLEAQGAPSPRGAPVSSGAAASSEAAASCCVPRQSERRSSTAAWSVARP